MVAVVDLGQVGEVSLRQAVERPEEPPVAAFGAEPLEALGEQALVGRAKLADQELGPIGERGSLALARRSRHPV